MNNPSAITSTVIALLILHWALLRLRAGRENEQTGAPKGSLLHLLATSLATVAGLSSAWLHFADERILGAYLFWAYIILGGTSTLASFNALDAELHLNRTGGKS